MDRIALVTGAARGLGLEMVRQLIDRGYRVIACPRKAGADALETLAAGDDRVDVVPMDVGDMDSIRAAFKAVGARVEHLDVLINNGAVYPKGEDAIDGCNLDRIAHAFDVNALGPLRVVQAFLPLLRRGTEKRLVQITSKMGSIADNSSGRSYAYRMSKSALNMATKNLAHDLGPEGFVSICIHPGWVKTDMGSPMAPLEIDEAVKLILDNALDSDRDASGTFLGPGGQVIPW